MGGGSSTSQILDSAKPLSDFYTIGNNYKTLADLQAGLRSAGLESSELIIGVDFTKSNLYNGAKSFGGHSLHALIDGVMNPYQKVLSSICQTMAGFDDDNVIPCYGFGDALSRAQKVFSFRDNDAGCQGLDEVLVTLSSDLVNVILHSESSYVMDLYLNVPT